MMLQLLLVMLAGWINRHQAQVITYLCEDNRILKGKRQGHRLRLTETKPEKILLLEGQCLF